MGVQLLMNRIKKIFSSILSFAKRRPVLFTIILIAIFLFCILALAIISVIQLLLLQSKVDEGVSVIMKGLEFLIKLF